MAEGIDLSIAKRPNGYAIRFEGILPIDRDGGYTFHVSSDDGGRVTIDGRTVVSNDGIHPAYDKSGRTRLEQGKPQGCRRLFRWSRPDEPRSRLRERTASLAEAPTRPRTPSRPTVLPCPKAADLARRFVSDPAKVDKGRGLFSSLGCASCHQLKDGRQGDRRLGRSRASLASLKPDSGCLAASTPKVGGARLPPVGSPASRPRLRAQAGEQPGRPIRSRSNGPLSPSPAPPATSATGLAV